VIFNYLFLAVAIGIAVFLVRRVVRSQGGPAVVGRRLYESTRAALTPRAVLTIAAVTGLLALLFLRVLPQIHTSHTRTGRWETPGPVLLLGLIIGLTYGLLAVGLVLIYRTNRIINFAHGQIGAFGAAFFGIEVVKWHIPYWVAFLPALAVAAGVGALAEAMVVRRLRRAPLIMSVVATLGVGQFLVLFAYAFNSQAGAGSIYPQPVGLPVFRVGALLVTPAYSGMLFLSPAVVLLVGLFLKFSRFGLGIRSAAANPEAARMAGIFSSRMSSLAWGIAGSLAAFSAILTQPTQGFTSGDSFGPSLLLVALTGAVLARMQSLPKALLAGAAIGITEQLLLWNYAQSGLVQVALFVIILLALLLQKQRVGRAEEKGSWAAVQGARPLPAAIRSVRSVRALGPAMCLLFFGAFLVLPQLISNANSVKVTGSFGFVIIGLSVGIITGLGGQLSLGQFALGAVGAFASYEVSRRTGNFVESFLYAGLAAAVVSVLIGIPALRIKGLLLTVTTLSFALVVPGFILQQDWVLGSGKDPGRPIINGHALETGRSYYYVGLATLFVALLIARNVRSGGLGRRLIAVRDNEDAARAFTVPASVVKLQGFALAGFIAGLGGAMYGHSLSLIGATSFPTRASIDVVVLTVIGGIGLLSGPILGAFLVQGATFLPLDAAGLAVTSLGQLIIILYLPGGLGSLVTPVRDRVANLLARRAGVDVEAAYAAERGFNASGTGSGVAPALTVAKHRRAAASGVLLQATGLLKSFGGVRAVRGVSFEVRPGETLGLIGPNGAGKTTTFELLAGFTKLDEGSVTYAGRDISGLGPEARGRMGLIRSFQDAGLFPTLTVLECVMLSLERVSPTQLVPSLLGLRRQEKRKIAQAEQLVAWMGLERYRSSQIQELSTGTRRITEIACLVALQPQLLLLDEPSSGVAQKETEALGALLVKLKAELGLTLVIIEHDIPLIMGISDRIVCMADGEVIAAGTPEHVRNDPVVVEAYLGGSIEAIDRSAGANPVGSTAASRRTPPTGGGTAVLERPRLSEVSGLGAAREAALLDAFGSLDAVRQAPVDQLTAVRGIGPGLAARIHTTLSGRTS
jgi:ABC-type branched-subunit amino acid transport system ATPase component/ABC-type branched-subunit amino acid transport system permease subunit